jgi:hypothetical protein
MADRHGSLDRQWEVGGVAAAVGGVVALTAGGGDDDDDNAQTTGAEIERERTGDDGPSGCLS